MLAPLPHNEEERLRELTCCGVLDTPPEPAFDRVTRLAARIFEVPIALISLVDRDRQWFKSRYGVEITETERGHSFCAYTILEPRTMVVPDVLRDRRFADYPLVNEPPFLRFYAGAPLTTSTGFRLGTLCVSDTVPRDFGAREIAMLEELAAIVVDELELRTDASRHQREIERRRNADQSMRAVRDELETRVQERTADLADAESRYRSLFENAMSGIYQIRPNFDGFLSVNPTFAALLGYPTPAALLTTLPDLDGIYVKAGRRAEFRRRLETDGIVTGMESEIYRSDCARIWISESARAIRDADGRLLRYEGTIEDITARRNATEALHRAHEELEDRVGERTSELALFNGTLLQQIAERERAEDNARRSETKFRALIENAQDLTAIATPEGVVLYLSPSVEHLLGYKPDDLIGRNIFDQNIHPDDCGPLRGQFSEIVADGARYVRSEARFLHKDGSWRLLESIASCSPPDFPIVSLIINSRDITERRHNEMEYVARVRQQTAVAELGHYALQGPELPSIFDKAADVIARALEVTFSTVTELLPGGARLVIRAGRGWHANVIGEEVANWRALKSDGDWFDPEPLVVHDVRQDPRYFTLPRATGNQIPSSAMSVVVHSGGRPFGTLAAFSSEPRDFSAQDVTFLQTVADLLSTLIESKRQEVVSHEAEARYQRIVANIPGVVFQYGRHADGTGFLPFISEGCRQLFGRDAAAVQADPQLLLDAIHPEDRAGYDVTVNASAQSLQPFEWEGRSRVSTGDVCWIAIRSRPERQASGDIIWDGVVLDVTELKRTQETLIGAKEEAEKANRAKSEFLSRMSHELRTPLNAILGFSQLLSLEDLPAVQASSVEQILNSGRHLLDLINEVLDIARIEAGGVAMTPERVLAGAALNEAVVFMQPLASQRRVSFIGGVPESCDVTLMADRGRLKQVLLNLFSNAIKYNNEGGEVRYGCEVLPDGKKVRLHVSDTGSGLSEDELARLFTPFQRLGAPHRGIPGTGIGLTITRSLVEAMGGTIGVESVPGQGSTFFVDLPVAADQTPASDGWTPSERDAATAILPTPCTILHIDDQPANLALVERVLEPRSDLRLIDAADGRTGLAIARDRRPDLILLDLHLPDLPGEEVIRRLRTEARTQHIPIIVLSADATVAQIERLYQLGAREYLTKPFKIQQLLLAIDRHLRSKPPSAVD